ncbi:MAG: ribonuclease HI family protein [bacterium]|nr:ribonuclease HI family protein [bacterium]
MEKITIFTDGGARGNPGSAGAGAVIFSAEGKVLKEISDYVGETTNNVAEYEALVRALGAAHKLFGKKLGGMQVEIKMDSELIVRQMQGRYKVKAPNLKEYFLHAQKLLQAMPHHSFVHIPREKNKHADMLVNRAIDNR